MPTFAGDKFADGPSDRFVSFLADELLAKMAAEYPIGKLERNPMMDSSSTVTSAKSASTGGHCTRRKWRRSATRSLLQMKSPSCLAAVFVEQAWPC